MPKRFPLNTEMFPFDTEKLILTNQPVEDKKGCCRCGSTYTLLLLLILLLLPSSSPPSKKKRTIGDDVFFFFFFFSFSFSFSFSFYFKKILQHPPNTITIDFQHLSFKISFHKNILIIFYLLSKYATSMRQVHANGHTSTAQQLRSSG